MIRVEINSENNKIKSISVKGHAMYDIRGKDIVCSAVSTCVITTVNGILEIDDALIAVIQKENEIIITLKEDNDIANSLLKNMIDILSDLEKQYPKNIRLSKEEFWWIN